MEVLKDQRSLSIRSATSEDADFLARCVLEAVGLEIFERPDEEMEAAVRELATLVAQADTLYSFRHALLAEVDGIPAGALISYEGAHYHALRNATFPHLAYFKGMDVDSMVDETGPGEFYLDSMAVLPQFRRHGVGTRLLQYRVQWASQHYPDLLQTLLVDPDNLQGQRIYRRLGFERVGECRAFGHFYWKMALKMGGC